MKNRNLLIKAFAFSIIILTWQVACNHNARYGSATPDSPTRISPSTLEIDTRVTPKVTTIMPKSSIRVTKAFEWVLSGKNILDIKWAPNSDKFIVLTSDEATLYDVSTYQKFWSITPIFPAEYASSVVFQPGGQAINLYIGGVGLQIHDVQSGRLLAEKPKGNNPGNCLQAEATGAVLSPDGHTLFISIEDHRDKSNDFTQVHRWDVSSLQCTGAFMRTEGHARSLDLTSDGKYLALSVGLNTKEVDNDIQENGQVTVWDLEVNQRACSIGHQGSIVRFKPRSSILVVTDPEKNKLAYWDVTTCDMVGELSGVTTLYNFTFSSDGRLLAIWKDGIWILDADSGDVLYKIIDPVPLTSTNIDNISRLLGKLSFSPNGRFLVYSIRREPIEGLIYLWSIEH